MTEGLVNDRLKSTRLRRSLRPRRRLRIPRIGLIVPQPCAVHASDAAALGASTPAAAAPAAATSVATLLTRHILRDGEIVLLILKPSLWTIFFASLPAIGIAVILMISARLWTPHHIDLGIETGVMIVGARVALAVLNWAGRLYLLTDLRIVRIIGIFNPQVHDIPLRKVARTRLTTSFRERICRLGSVEIIPESDHWPWSVWQTIPKPVQVHEVITRAITRAKQGGCYGARW